MKTTVSERGQITLPKAIRTALGIQSGTILDVTVEGGKITACKREEIDPVHSWRGKGVHPSNVRTTDEYIAMVRDE